MTPATFDGPANKAEVPHIKVEVSYNGDTVSHQGPFFMDAISFLCRAEEAVRRGMGAKGEADAETGKITKENMARLLERIGK